MHGGRTAARHRRSPWCGASRPAPSSPGAGPRVRSGLRRSASPVVGFATRMRISGGTCAPTGSESSTRPSSTRLSAATPQTGLVIEAMAKMASARIGTRASASSQPTASRCASRPSRAMATTPPGKRPASTSRCRAGPIRARRAEDMPTASGRVGGSGGVSICIVSIRWLPRRHRGWCGVPSRRSSRARGRR